MKIMLDPLIYAFEYDRSKFKYFNDVVCFINKYLDMKYMSSSAFVEQLSRLNEKPFSQYKYDNEAKYEVIKKILTNIDYSDSIGNAVFLDEIEYPLKERSNYFEINQSFLEMFYVAKKDNNAYLLFLAAPNFSAKYEEFYNINLVKHIYKEIDSYLAYAISTNKNIKNNAMLVPTMGNVLPNQCLCSEYTDVLNEKIHAGDDRIITHILVGKEVILRNGYKYNDTLSKLNSNKGQIRDIYSYKDKIYLSIDVENGLIEVFDHTPCHQGACDYTGTIRPNSKDPKNHKIILHK